MNLQLINIIGDLQTNLEDFYKFVSVSPIVFIILNTSGSPRSTWANHKRKKFVNHIGDSRELQYEMLHELIMAVKNFRSNIKIKKRERGIYSFRPNKETKKSGATVPLRWDHCNNNIK